MASQKITRLIEQCLSEDQTQLIIEDTKIKKKHAPCLFKSLQSLSSILTMVEIKSCRLKKIPPEINLLTGLRVLKIEDNLIQDLPPMNALTNLRELGLSANDFHNFPESITALHSLTSLDLTANNVAWIPGTVSQLTSLINLSLDSNGLPYFPIPVSLLTSLKIFNCCDNGLRVFPAQVFQLTRIQALIMSQNAFQYIPSELQDIKRSLTYLDLSDNCISKLPAEMGSLVKLRTLLLQHNKIIQLPEEMGNMESLETLKLHDNQIISLPSTFGRLTNLVELYLQENELSSLPPQLGDCASLRKLRLEYNKLTSLPDTISKLSKLNVFMLHDNYLAQIPPFMNHPHFLRHLLRITLHDNRFSDNTQNDISNMGALNFLLQCQEGCNDNAPILYGPVKKSTGKDTVRRTTRVGNNADTPSNDGGWLRDIAASSKVLTPTARRRASSVDEALPLYAESVTRSRSASVGSYLAAPPYRTFQSVYEFIVDELDLSGKRKEMLYALPHEDKWKLLSNISRESAMNLLMTNSKVRFTSSIVNSPAVSAPSSPRLGTATPSSVVSSPMLNRLSASSPLIGASPSPIVVARTPSSPVVSHTRAGVIPPLNLGDVSMSPAMPRGAKSPGGCKSPKSPKGSKLSILSSSSRSPRGSVSQAFVLSQNISMDSISTIKENLTTQSVSKITAFAESGGIDHILQIIKSVSGRPGKSEDDYVILLEALHCVNILLGIGLESLLISDTVDIVATNLVSDHLPLKEATITVLDEVCNVFFVGQGLVVDAMKNLCKRNNRSSSELFLPLYELIANPDVHVVLKVSTMKLVNNLITNTDDLEERCKIRNSFLNLGMTDQLSVLKAHPYKGGSDWSNLLYQIEEFEVLMSDDCEEIGARFKLSQLQFSPEIVENAIQNTALRVVLPSVSLVRMTCLVEQHVCDHTTTARDVIVGMLQTCSLAVKECSEYALWVPAAYARSKPEEGQSENGYFLDDKRRVLNYALDGVILELKLKPWTIEVELCESILASRRNALNMQDLRESLETLLATRNKGSNNNNNSVSSPNPTRQAISKSSGALQRPKPAPRTINTAMHKSTSCLTAAAKADNSFGEVTVDADPYTTCGAFVSQVLQKFHGNKVYEVEDFGFFLPNIKERLLGTGNQDAGMWLEPTEKLLSYRNYVTKVKLQLRLMPKTLKVRLTEDTFELVSYDESTPIRTIINDVYKRVLTPAGKNNPHVSQYGIHLGGTKRGGGTWLDPEKKLKYYALPQRAMVRFALKPKAVTITREIQAADGTAAEGGGNPTPVPPQVIKRMVPFHLSIKEIMEYLKVPLEGAAVYLSSEKSGAQQLLDTNLSLFDQNVSENATLVVKPASAEISLFDPASVNIWEEPENANTIVYNTENFPEIHAATLNKLVERLTSEKDHDQSFTQVFLATYKTFTTDEVLFEKIYERYNIPENRADATDCSVVRLRVIVFLKNWLESFNTHNNSGIMHSKHEEELPQNVVNAIDRFINTCLARDGYTALAAPLKKMLKIKHQPATPPQSPRSPDFSNCNPMRLANGFTWLIDDWSFAFQLTLKEWKVYSHIKAREFINEKDHGEAVQQMIADFNHVAAWVPTAVMSEPKLSQRARVLDKFIKLASHLHELNNFHLLTAVLSGINNSAISRLKWTLAKIPKRSKQMLEDLEAVMSMEGSFKNYRNSLENATPPCVPYLGVYLTDAVFIEDGNPNKVGNMINVTKRRFLYNIVETIQRYQRMPYEDRYGSDGARDGAADKTPNVTNSHASSHNNAPANSSHMANISAFLTFLYKMPIMTDKQLYDLSLAREPRNSERHEIE